MPRRGSGWMRIRISDGVRIRISDGVRIRINWIEK
jgi:hypothetical protein